VAWPAPVSINRFLDYARRHGFRAAIGRLWLSIRRLWTGDQMVLHFCDLRSFTPPAGKTLNNATVERKKVESEVQADDLLQITSAGNSSIVRHRLSERFARGASLWLGRVDGKLAGYGWSLVGQTVEPHFFPLGANDVHLFDFYVLPQFRGQRINPWIVNHILTTMGREMKHRAFIEAAVWNAPQLSSLKRTPFVPFGRASKYCLFGKTLVLWGGNSAKLE
jgi:GNAT superfamily N-acetyltransferase